MRRPVLAVIVLVILAALLLAAGPLALRNRFVATGEPGRVETAVALRLRSLSIPGDARRAISPVAGREDAWREGALHFLDHCAVCHSDDGRGGGEIGPNLYPPVPDMTEQRTQRMTDGELFYIIANGIRWTGMPAWKYEKTPDEIWQMVEFVKRLPSLTPEEMDEIRR
jgi:mono/diheme cytochrome c family protein